MLFLELISMSARVVHLALLLAVGVAGFAPVARPVGPTRRAGAVQCRLNAGGKGPLQMAGTEGEGGEVRKGRFLAYVKSEKELEEWKKANPVDPVQVLKGPLTSVAILTAGYYAIVRCPAQRRRLRSALTASHPRFPAAADCPGHRRRRA